MTPRHRRLMGGGPCAPVIVERAGGGGPARPPRDPLSPRLLRRAAREGAAVLRCERASVWHVAPDGSAPICLVRFHRGEDRYREGIPYPDEMGGETVRLFERLSVLSMEDVSTAPPPAAPLLRYLEGEGIRAILAAPIRHGGRVRGWFAFEDLAGPRSWDPGDRDHAVALALQVERLWKAAEEDPDARPAPAGSASGGEVGDPADADRPRGDRPGHRNRIDPPREDRPAEDRGAGTRTSPLSPGSLPRSGDLHLPLRPLRPMEALGVLSVDMTDDLDHLLQVQAGYLTLLEDLLDRGREGAGRDGELDRPAEGTEGPRDPQTEEMELVRDAKRAGEEVGARIGRFLEWIRSGEEARGPVELNAFLGTLAMRLGKVTGDRVRLLLAPASEPLTVRTHHALLQRAVEHLVRNAREASEDGSRVRVAVSRGEGTPPVARIVVEDRGVGIRAADLPWIFEPFFTTRRSEGGTGFGLSLVQAVVEGQGGWVDVESTPGEGTRFTLNLPLDEGNAPAERPADPRPAAEPDRPLVLLVEDDPFLARLMERTLDRGGFRVQRADGTASASRVLHRAARSLSLVAVERTLPGGDRGAEVIQRALALSPGLPAVLIDRHRRGPAPTSSDLARIRALEELPDEVGFLLPPFHPPDLIGTVRSLVRTPRAGAGPVGPESPGPDPVH